MKLFVGQNATIVSKTQYMVLGSKVMRSGQDVHLSCLMK